MNRRTIICEAINARRLLRLVYNGKTRNVEPHCLGTSTTGKATLRAYQIDADQGWRLFTVDKIETISVSEERFSQPRVDYKRHDPAMVAIICAV